MVPGITHSRNTGVGFEVGRGGGGGDGGSAVR